MAPVRHRGPIERLGFTFEGGAGLPSSLPRPTDHQRHPPLELVSAAAGRGRIPDLRPVQRERGLDPFTDRGAPNLDGERDTACLGGPSSRGPGTGPESVGGGNGFPNDHGGSDLSWTLIQSHETNRNIMKSSRRPERGPRGRYVRPMAALPPPIVRRPISLTLVTLALAGTLALSVIVVPLLSLVDFASRSPLRRVRLWCLLTGVLAVELSAAVVGIVLLTWHVGRVDGDRAQRRLHGLEQWWAARHAGNFRRFAGLRWNVENPEELRHADAIVLARHASHADALLPLILFGNMGGHRLLYTLKEELQWAPAMDIVGNRLPNVFVNRTPGPDSALEDRIEALATLVDDDHVAVIFPEGTFFTPQRLERAATRIAETRPDLEAAARSLRHLLPPRPAGTNSLLRGAPTADLVLVAHVGMEEFGDLAAIRRNLPLAEPVRVRLWRIPRGDVPVDEDEFVEWLLARWIDVDRWIETRAGEQRDRASAAAPGPDRTGAGP